MTLTESDSADRIDRSDDERPIALFLDFDGTLVEIAPMPDAVKLDRQVAPALEVLRRTLGGALALVSGRPIPFLDAMLEPYLFDAAGLHGAQIRMDGEVRLQADVPEAMREATRDLVRFANGHVGVIVEDKRISIALHWRLAPQLRDEALALARGIAARMGPSIRLQEGKAVAELVPAAASKGAAIGWLMGHAPYAGRMPVFIGDDITDEAGFETVNRLGGMSIRIGAGETCAMLRIASPTDLRAILLAAADTGALTAASFSRT